MLVNRVGDDRDAVVRVRVKGRFLPCGHAAVAYVRKLLAQAAEPGPVTGAR